MNPILDSTQFVPVPRVMRGSIVLHWRSIEEARNHLLMHLVRGDNVEWTVNGWMTRFGLPSMWQTNSCNDASRRGPVATTSSTNGRATEIVQRWQSTNRCNNRCSVSAHGRQNDALLMPSGAHLSILSFTMATNMLMSTLQNDVLHRRYRGPGTPNAREPCHTMNGTNGRRICKKKTPKPQKNVETKMWSRRFTCPATKLLAHATRLRGELFLNDENIKLFFERQKYCNLQMTEWSNNSYFDYNVGTEWAV